MPSNPNGGDGIRKVPARARTVAVYSCNPDNPLRKICDVMAFNRRLYIPHDGVTFRHALNAQSEHGCHHPGQAFGHRGNRERHA